MPFHNNTTVRWPLPSIIGAVGASIIVALAITGCEKKPAPADPQDRAAASSGAGKSSERTAQPSREAQPQDARTGTPSVEAEAPCKLSTTVARDEMSKIFAPMMADAPPALGASATTLETQKYASALGQWKRHWALYTETYGGCPKNDFEMSAGRKLQCFLWKSRKEIPLNGWECNVVDLERASRGLTALDCSVECGGTETQYIAVLGYGTPTPSLGQILRFKRFNTVSTVERRGHLLLQLQYIDNALRPATSYEDISDQGGPVLALIRKLKSQKVDDRLHAAAGLADLKTTAALPALIETLAGDSDANVRVQAAAALGGFGRQARLAAAPLGAALKDTDEGVRIVAADALWKVESDQTAVGVLAAGLSAKDPGNRLLAAMKLGEIGPKARSAVPALTKAQQDADSGVAMAAREALKKVDQRPKRKRLVGEECHDDSECATDWCPCSMISCVCTAR